MKIALKKPFLAAQSRMAALGERLRLARLRRRLTVKVMCVRMPCSKATWARIEAGDPTVAMGRYDRALEVMGLANDLNGVAADDELGRRLQDLNLSTPHARVRQAVRFAPRNSPTPTLGGGEAIGGSISMRQRKGNPRVPPPAALRYCWSRPMNGNANPGDPWFGPDAEPAPQGIPEPRPSTLLKLPVNGRGRDWFVGDLHGELHLLEYFLDKVKFDPAKDRLISTGDLIDRGPESQRLLEFFARNEGWFFAALGNHDAMMRESVLSGCFDSQRAWARNGNAWASSLHREDQQRLAAMLERVPPAIEIPLHDGRVVGVVHAEVPEYSHWADIGQIDIWSGEAAEAGGFNGNRLLWGRSRATKALLVRSNPKAVGCSMLLRARAIELLKPIAGIDLVVAGHTPLQPQTPLQCANMLWIDTGGGYQSGRLTFVDLVAGEYAQFSHGRKAYRRSKLPAPISLEGWKLTPDEQAIADAERAEQEEKNRKLLELFGFDPPKADKPRV